MAAKKPAPARRAPAPAGRAPAPADARTVNDFMRDLDHPLEAEVEALRRIILAANPRIQEGIKWNAPSFRVDDWFATIDLHSKTRLRVILHKGAKVKDNSTAGVAIADPSKLLKWPAKERALVEFADMADIEAKRAAFARIVDAWVGQL